MTYVVTEGCIRCKYMDCVEVCPAQCFYEGATMLVINPAECIDCGLCEPNCPEEAIVPDSYPEAARWLDINQQYSLVWPNIRVAKDPPADAEEFHKRDNKFDEFFSPAPAPAPA